MTLSPIDRRPWRRAPAACVLLAIAALLGGCGQSGPLVLPGGPASGDAGAPATADPSPADEEENADADERTRNER